LIDEEEKEDIFEDISKPLMIQISNQVFKGVV
jgi:hypothetical protein